VSRYLPNDNNASIVHPVLFDFQCVVL